MTGHDVCESKHVVSKEYHEEVKDIHEVARTDVIPDQVFRPDEDDDANEDRQAQAGESN